MDNISKKCNSEKGMMLVTILMLIFLLIMLTVSMLTLTSETLNLTGMQNRKVRAFQSAEAGVEYALYQLNNDSTWTPALNIPEYLGNEQSFEYTFATNNLKGNSPAGSTPPYSSEIICRGHYKDNSQDMRIIFVREEMLPYPIISEGDLKLVPYFDMIIRNEDTIDPGRLHSNSNIYLQENWANRLPDLNDGFCSTVLDVIYGSGGTPVPKIKTQAVPVKIPDINIGNIITAQRPSCRELLNERFYLVGYFEYNGPLDTGTDYCIPHLASTSYPDYPTDPCVYSDPYKLGIAAIDENSYNDFLTNYWDFYHNPTVNDPGRNFYNYGYTIDFWEFDPNNTTNNYPPLNIDVTRTVDSDGFIYLTLSLKENLYIGSTFGMFETGHINCGYVSSTIIYHIKPMYDAAVRLDLNGFNIYGEKVYLDVPVSGTGAIISNQTVDFTHSFDGELAVLSGESVNMVETLKRKGAATNNFNGFLYGKDDVLIQTKSTDTPMIQVLNLYGAMAAKDEVPGNCTSSPMVCGYSYEYFSSNCNIFMNPVFTMDCDIIHTDSGVPILVPIRGNDFKVRKKYIEILK